MALVVEVCVGESGGIEETGFGLGGVGAGFEDLGDLLTDCRTDLLTRLGIARFPHGGEDRGEQKLNEGVGVPGVVALGEHLVVIGLAIMDDGPDGKVCEE